MANELKCCKHLANIYEPQQDVKKENLFSSHFNTLQPEYNV